MAQTQVLEGTWDEIKLHDRELTGKRFRLVPVPPEPAKPIAPHRKGGQDLQSGKRTEPKQLTGMGKFAGIIPSSEEFMRQKQDEIDLEERKLTR